MKHHGHSILTKRMPDSNGALLHFWLVGVEWDECLHNSIEAQSVAVQFR